MAKLSTDERINLFVDRIADQLTALDQSEISAREVVRHKLAVILRRCGYERLSPKALARIDAALVERQIYAQPGLTEPGLAREQVVYFGRTEPEAPSPPRSQMFDVESDLEKFIEKNFDSLEPFRGLELIKNQFELPKLRRADLLARDRGSGGLVLIELKNDDGTDRLVAQVRGYVDAIMNFEGKSSGKLRVVVVTGQPNAVLKRYLEELVGDRASVEWYVYEVSLTLHPA